MDRKDQSCMTSKKLLISLVAIILIIMIISTLVFLIFIRSQSSDASSCGNFDEGPFCLATQLSNKNHSSDLKRTYSTRTTYDQSTKLLDQIVDPIKVPKNCEPTMFYLFSRHSIRYPKSKSIVEMAEILPKLQNEILAAASAGSGELCQQDLNGIKEWKLKMVPKDDNHVTPSGVNATRKIAQQFYQRFPSLFDSKTVNLSIGITRKVRTNETAHAYMEGLKEIEPDIQFSEQDFKIRDHLEFHTICKKKLGVKLPKPRILSQLSDSKLFAKLRQRISTRMGLNRTISDNELDTMYVACSFEQAIYDSAPWCSLFTEKELKVLEFREDIEHYYKNGPGLELNGKMACPLVKDLYQSVEKSVSNPASISTYLYFSHAGAMSRLWSTFGVYDKLKIKENFCPDSDREWKTSLILPFNVNFEAVLYRCGGKTHASSVDEYKLLTMMNGYPFEIDHCDGPLCKVSKFLKSYQKMVEKCDLDQICKLPKSITDAKPFKPNDDDD